MNFYKLLIYSLVFAVAFGACKSNDDYFSTVISDGLDKGAFVVYADQEKFTGIVDFSAFTSSYSESRVINDQNGNLTSISYDLIANIGGVADTTENVFSSTTFPFTLELSRDIIAQWAGVDASTILAGDFFKLVGKATRTDGIVFSPSNFGGNLGSDSYFGAMDIDMALACPFLAAEAAGFYLITNDPFGTTLDPASPIEAVVNAAGDGVIFKDLFKHPEAFDVEFIFNNPTLGLVEVARQPAWHCDNFGCGFGEGRVNGSGSFFTCIGKVNVELQHTVDAGSFGTFNLQLQKQ